MRNLFRTLVFVSCSVAATYCAQQEDLQLMFDQVNTFAQAWQDRLQEAAENNVSIIPANEQEKHDLVMWHGLFLVLAVRLHQDASCLIDQEKHMQALALMWQYTAPLFTLFEPETFKAGIEQAIMYLEAHRDDAWQPEGNLEAYIPQTEWADTRKQVVDEFIAQLQLALASVDDALNIDELPEEVIA